MLSEKHARLSASAAHRWIECPASVSMEERCPDWEGEDVFAAEGRVAHELAEICLRTGENARAYVGKARIHSGSSPVPDEEMAEAVQSYLDYVRQQVGTLLVERRVDFSPWAPGGFGTADAILLDNGRTVVVDLKFGRGVRLHAENNPQLMLYALGAANEYGNAFDMREFRLSVVQPRLAHVSEWEISRRDLLEWAETVVKPAAEQALSSTSPPARPGARQCRFCRAKGACAALAGYSMDVASRGKAFMPGDGSESSFGLLADDEIAVLLPKLQLVEKWAANFREFAISEMEKGRSFPGYRLSTGRAVRKWTNDRKAAAALLARLPAEEVFIKKLIGPAQAEKKLGKGDALVETLAVKPVGKPTIVRDRQAPSDGSLEHSR